MRKHHIYNFHIGFWGAFLISLALIIHSSVLLVASSAISQAQTSPFITIDAPTNGAQYNIGDNIDITVTTADNAASVSGIVTNTTNGQSSSANFTTSDFITWSSSHFALSDGQYTLDISATEAQSGANHQSQSTFVVGQQIVITNTLLLPQNNETVSGLSPLKARTNIQVDSLVFNIKDSTGQTIQSIQGNASTVTDWDAQFDTTSLQNGNYTVEAEASLSGAVTTSTSNSFTVDNSAQGNVTLNLPANNAILSGATNPLNASTDIAPSSVSFQIFPGLTSSFDNIPGTNPSLDQITWTANLDTTIYQNGAYTIIAVATFSGQATPSATTAITIDNQTTTTDPLAITQTTFQSGQVGQAYSKQLQATGGQTPYNWSIDSGTLPSGLTLNNQDGTISGVPTNDGSFALAFRVTDATGDSQTLSGTIVIAAPAQNGNGGTPVCGDGTQDSTEQCDDGNVTNGDGCSSSCQLENSTQDPASGPASLAISSPSAGTVLQGSNNLVIIQGSEPINQPQVLLTDTAGQNVLANATNAPFKPLNSNGGAIWQYVIDARTIADGNYTLRVTASTSSSGEALTAPTVSVSVDNPNTEDEQPSFSGGLIVKPTEGQTLSGIVLLQAQANGDIDSVIFTVQTFSNGSFPIPASFNASKGLWEATWDSAGIRGGGTIVRASVTTAEGFTGTLPKISFVLQAVEPVLTTTQEAINDGVVEPTLVDPRIEDVINPAVLDNVDGSGQLPDVPVECQLEQITDKRACDEYLATRQIRVLTPAEEERARSQISEVVSQHVSFKEDGAIPRNFAQDTSGNRIEAPLEEILPIRTDRKQDDGEESEETFLIAPSTRPPASLARFVEQTVPAVLIPDRDGDGLSDDAEERYGSDPDNPDTDGDGFKDGIEIRNGFDPTGPGPLNVVLAPTDVALLNNRPLDQPRFAGVTEEDVIKVEDAQPVTEDEEAVLLTGKAEPFSFVTLFVYSSLPVVVSVQADANGEWEYEFTHPLVDGKHEVYATVTNETGAITKKSRALSFFVQEAKAVTEEEFLRTAITVEDSSGTFLAYYLAGGVLIIMLGGILFFYYIRSQKAYS